MTIELPLWVFIGLNLIWAIFCIICFFKGYGTGWDYRKRYDDEKD